MIAERLFEKIGFDEEMISGYEKYHKIFGSRLDKLAEFSVKGDISFYDAYKIARDFEPDIHEYTTDLMFVLECTGYLLEKYRQNGIPDEMFYTAMIDIRCKLGECMRFKKIFGQFAIGWYGGFINLTRFAFGRLQYDIERHKGEPLKIGDRIIEEGDLVLNCHIPSSGPMPYEACIQSYKMAYEYFKNELKDGVLVIRCQSYLIFPDYKEVYEQGSTNIYNFMRDFEIYKVEYTDEFKTSWRVFNVLVEGHKTDNLPNNTRLQRSFIKYIEQGGRYGDGFGVILFDGEKALTHMQ